jgi:hypothetical protein
MLKFAFGLIVMRRTAKGFNYSQQNYGAQYGDQQATDVEAADTVTRDGVDDEAAN